MNNIEPKRSGFTLIELLVVIGIVVSLVAFLMPSLSMARSQAKALICKTNLRGLHLGVVYYANDYDGWSPSKEKTRQLGGWWPFRAAKGYRAEHDRRGVEESFGLNALFNDLKYIPSGGDVWICADLGMKWMEDYGCTYTYSMAPNLSKYKYTELTQKYPRTPMISDNINFYPPSPTGWYVEETSRPESFIPEKDKVMPHRYLARTKWDEQGNPKIDHETWMTVANDGWIGTNGDNKERMPKRQP